MGETSRGDGNIIDDVSLPRSKEHTLVVPYLEEAPFMEFDGDIALNSDTPSIEHINPICSELFDSTRISSPLPPTSPTYMHIFHESLSDIRGYSPSVDPYCAHLEDVPRKIKWSTFFDHTFDFSTVFGKFKGPLTLFAPSFLVFSYPHHSDLHAITYDKVLRALMASAWHDLSLDVGSGLCSSSLRYPILVRLILGAPHT